LKEESKERKLKETIGRKKVERSELKEGKS
jgi:hypothetical protein